MQRKNKKSIKSSLKIILFTTAAVYALYILVQQQIMINSYREQAMYYETKIAEERQKQEKLERLQVLYNTEMYIEKIARDKLGLVKPGERVFIDMSNN